MIWGILNEISGGAFWMSRARILLVRMRYTQVGSINPLQGSHISSYIHHAIQYISKNTK